MLKCVWVMTGVLSASLMLAASSSRASLTANTNSEALAGHVAAQNKKIQGPRDDMDLLQGTVASDSATLQSEREMRARKHAEFVPKKTGCGTLRVLTKKTDDIPATARALLQF